MSTTEGIVGVVDLAQFGIQPPKGLYEFLTSEDIVTVWWNRKADFEMWEAAYPTLPLSKKNAFDAKSQAPGLPTMRVLSERPGLREVMERHFGIIITGSTPYGRDLFCDLRHYMLHRADPRVRTFQGFLQYTAYDAMLPDLLLCLAHLAETTVPNQGQPEAAWELLPKAFARNPEIQRRVRVVSQPMSQRIPVQNRIIKRLTDIHIAWERSGRFYYQSYSVFRVGRGVIFGATRQHMPTLFDRIENFVHSQEYRDLQWRNIEETGNYIAATDGFMKLGNIRLRGPPRELTASRRASRKEARDAYKDRRENETFPAIAHGTLNRQETQNLPVMKRRMRKIIVLQPVKNLKITG